MLALTLLSLLAAPGPRPAPVVRSLSAADKAFLVQAAQGNNYELRAAAIASQKSSNADVKAFAQMMTTDHNQAGDAVKAATMKADPSYQLPTGVGAALQAKLDALNAAGSNFNALYKQQMIAGHAEMHALFSKYVAKPGSNADIKSTINGIIPTVQKHWDAAKKLPGM